MTNIEEIWKDIPTFYGYQVSNLGRIKSLESKRYFGNEIKTFKERILKCHKNSRGYRYFMPFYGVNKKLLFVHRAVCYAFLGISELEVDHINGVKNDNRIENLRYCTRRQNLVYHFTKINKLTGATKSRNRWHSRIFVDGSRKYLGTYDTAEQAHGAYLKALSEIEKEKKK